MRDALAGTMPMLLPMFSGGADPLHRPAARQIEPQSGVLARQLDAGDIEAMKRVYGSRDKVMLRPKRPRQRRAADCFAPMLERGYEAYGSFLDEELRAFCIVGPWGDLPFFTFSLMQSLPVPGPVNLQRNGLSFCIDAALSALEERGYTHMVFQRIDDPKWRRAELLRAAGRMREYSFKVIESIAAGGRSRWDLINARVLDKRRASHDSLIVIGAKPEAA